MSDSHEAPVLELEHSHNGITVDEFDMTATVTEIVLQLKRNRKCIQHIRTELQTARSSINKRKAWRDFVKTHIGI